MVTDDIPRRLTAYSDVRDAFRCAELATLVNDGTEAFRGGTVLRIEGDAHRRRRKAMSHLLRGGGGRRLREEVILPLIRRDIAAAGRAFDLVVFARRLFFGLAAEVIGLDGVEGHAQADELQRRYQPINAAMGGAIDAGDQQARVAAALEAKERFRERYYAPALERHASLADDELPNDLLALIVRGADPSWSADPDLGLREAMTDMLNAGTSSTTGTLVWALHDLLEWLEAHPEHRPLAADPSFLGAAVQESLRLHATLPLFQRVALSRVTLPSGLEIAAGEIVALDVDAANRDTRVFGPDAGEYEPRRTVPAGTQRHGLAFGSGRHMCFGIPLVLGGDGTSGSHPQTLRLLLEAGVARDPGAAAAKQQDTLRDAWATYPVVRAAACP